MKKQIKLNNVMFQELKNMVQEDAKASETLEKIQTTWKENDQIMDKKAKSILPFVYAVFIGIFILTIGLIIGSKGWPLGKDVGIFTQIVAIPLLLAAIAIMSFIGAILVEVVFAKIWAKTSLHSYLVPYDINLEEFSYLNTMLKKGCERAGKNIFYRFEQCGNSMQLYGFTEENGDGKGE